MVGGTNDVWTIIPEMPGFVYVRGEEEPDDGVLIDAVHLQIYVGVDASWHSIGHAIECAERISRTGGTFEALHKKVSLPVGFCAAG